MYRTLDRVPEFDPKSREFPIRELVGNPIPRSYSWACNTWLDQGSEGACVGFSWTHELAARPVVISVKPQLALDIYHWAQKNDEWPGEAYSGTSVLAGAKALYERGFMDEYRWAFGIQDMIQAVGYKGPGVLGTYWRTGMFDTDADGFLHPEGEVAGGHAILVNRVRLFWLPNTSMTIRQSALWYNGLDVNKSYFTVHNSWGYSWGQNGEAKISIADMAKLLADQGEFCIPVRRSKGA